MILSHHPRFTRECGQEEINDDDGGAQGVSETGFELGVWGVRVAGSRTLSRASETCLLSVWAQGVHGYLADMKPPTPLGLP